MGKASQEYQKLIEYIKNLPDVVTVMYDEVERETGVSMDKNTGHRQKLAKAIIKCGRRALPVLGIGYDIDRPEIAVDIVRRSGRKVYSQIQRSSETHKVITTRHFDKVTDGDKTYLRQTGMVLNILQRKTIDFKRIDIETIKVIPPPELEARK